MNELVNPAVLTIILAWIYLVVVYTGLGFWSYRLFNHTPKGLSDLFLSFWIGWAFSFGFLQIWHFFFKVNTLAFLLISFFGFIGFFSSLTKTPSKDSVSRREKFIDKAGCFLFFGIFILMTIWVAYRAVLPPFNYDSGYYHINAMRWQTSYPVVPGLGLLHGRLAFGTGFYFLYPAMLEAGLWYKRSHNLASGLLLIMLIAQSLYAWCSIIHLKLSEKISTLLSALAFPVVYMLCWNVNVSSPSPDLPVFILGIVTSIGLVAFLEETDQKKKNFLAFFLFMLTVTGFLIKLSFLAMAIGIILVVMIIQWRDDKKDNKGLRQFLVVGTLLCFVLIVPWLIRNVILTGYLIYPSTLISFPVEWRVPKASVINIANTTFGMSRDPGAHWSQVLGNSAWFLPWVKRTLSNQWYVMIPLLFSIFFGLGIIAARANGKIDYKKQAVLLFVIPCVLSLMAWAFLFPAIRFLGASLWVLALGLCVYFIHSYRWTSLNIKRNLVIGIGIILLFCAHSLKDPYSSREMAWVERFKTDAGFYQMPSFQLNSFLTSWGVTIYQPNPGELCFDTHLLCTPSVHQGLRLRESQNLRYGFKMDPFNDQDALVGIHSERFAQFNK